MRASKGGGRRYASSFVAQAKARGGGRGDGRRRGDRVEWRHRQRALDITPSRILITQGRPNELRRRPLFLSLCVEIAHQGITKELYIRICNILMRGRIGPAAALCTNASLDEIQSSPSPKRLNKVVRDGANQLRDQYRRVTRISPNSL